MNEIPAIQNAAGTETPIPRPDSGSLNIIAASGADPVTMQNRICGRPSAFLASSVDPVSRPRTPSCGGCCCSGTLMTSAIELSSFDCAPPPRPATDKFAHGLGGMEGYCLGAG